MNWKAFMVCALITMSPLVCSALDGIEVLSGYFKADLNQNDEDYEGIPLLVGFNFDGRPLLEKAGIETAGRFDLIIEPFFNTMTSPGHTDIEVGSNFLFKYVFPLTESIQPYVKGGVGALYMSEHTREQSTQYNFLPQGGAGFHVFMDEKTALSFEWRFRHLSNASIESPNSGIDGNMFLGGISFYFE
ncbi:MAG: hypothetical protein GF333_07580 [Candidatus Omnitrophica bacterium]|nr:hypothetical protein [Candidatus Omnitrophota bacterium]